MLSAFIAPQCNCEMQGSRHCRYSLDEFHKQRFELAALVIVWPRHGMYRERWIKTIVFGGRCAVPCRFPLGTEGLTSRAAGSAAFFSPSLWVLSKNHLHLERAVLLKVSPLPSGAHNWSTVGIKAWATCPNLGRLWRAVPASKLLVGSAKALAETAPQAHFSLCCIELYSFPLTGADPQKLPKKPLHPDFHLRVCSTENLTFNTVAVSVAWFQRWYKLGM